MEDITRYGLLDKSEMVICIKLVPRLNKIIISRSITQTKDLKQGLEKSKTIRIHKHGSSNKEVEDLMGLLMLLRTSLMDST